MQSSDGDLRLVHCSVQGAICDHEQCSENSIERGGDRGSYRQRECARRRAAQRAQAARLDAERRAVLGAAGHLLAGDIS